MNPWLTILVVTVALLVSAGGGYLLVAGLFRLIANEPPAGSTPDPGELDRSDHPAEKVLRGGTWIGILERLATTASLLAGQVALVAVVVAIKGFGRFDQLKGNPAASEKFTVGTMASLLWAGAVGGLARLVLAWLA